ncbi:MAG TPA: hypothetical protein VF073_08280 [Gaiella sp.]
MGDNLTGLLAQLVAIDSVKEWVRVSDTEKVTRVLVDDARRVCA